MMAIASASSAHKDHIQIPTIQLACHVRMEQHPRMERHLVDLLVHIRLIIIVRVILMIYMLGSPTCNDSTLLFANLLTMDPCTTCNETMLVTTHGFAQCTYGQYYSTTMCKKDIYSNYYVQAKCSLPKGAFIRQNTYPFNDYSTLFPNGTCTLEPYVKGYSKYTFNETHASIQRCTDQTCTACVPPLFVPFNSIISDLYIRNKQPVWLAGFCVMNQAAVNCTLYNGTIAIVAPAASLKPSPSASQLLPKPSPVAKYSIPIPTASPHASKNLVSVASSMRVSLWIFVLFFVNLLRE